MGHSPTIGQIGKALAAAQAELEPVRKDKTAAAGKYSYNYADLSSVISHVAAVLPRHGIAYTQTMCPDERGTLLITTLIHAESGEWIESVMPVIVAKPNDPQALGSGITYARRYALLAIVGMAAEDDDAQSAMPARGRRENPPAQTPREPTLREQLAASIRERRMSGDAYTELCVEALGRVPTREDMTDDDRRALIEALGRE